MRPHHIIVLCLFALLFMSCDNDEFIPDDGRLYDGIAKHHVYQLYHKAKEIESSGNNQQADFIYITDTHIADNLLNSPRLLRFLCSHRLADRIFWGGDAISAYGDIESEWHQQQRLFLNSISQGGHYYMVRGNHEFTTSQYNGKQGITYDAALTALKLRQHSEADIVRPADAPNACYYYVDDASRKLRYCIFDTTDTITSVKAPWGTFPHVSQQQLEWMDENALHQVPEGYQLIVFTHIGVLPETNGGIDALEPLHQLLLHAEAPILAVFSGHKHQDFQTFNHSTLHILTGSDACYHEYSNSPFLHQYQRKGYHSTEQLMDAVCLSSDRRMLHLIRIGAGYNRTFHLDTLQVSLGKNQQPRQLATQQIASSKIATWSSYDAAGYTCQEEAWDPSNSVIDVSPTGAIIPRHEGQAVAMATSQSGDKEFFNIVVIP